MNATWILIHIIWMISDDFKVLNRFEAYEGVAQNHYFWITNTLGLALHSMYGTEIQKKKAKEVYGWLVSQVEAGIQNDIDNFNGTLVEPPPYTMLQFLDDNYPINVGADPFDSDTERLDALEGSIGALGTASTHADTDFAEASHTHIIEDVTGLQTALNGKAASSHSHAISDVTGLQTALDGKAATSHTHTASQITDFNTSVDARLTGKSDKSNFNALSTISAHGQAAGATNAATNNPTNAPADARTDYGALAAILGAEANVNNAKQNSTASNVNTLATNVNALATKYNDLATKVNALEPWLDTNRTAINNLRTAGLT